MTKLISLALAAFALVTSVGAASAENAFTLDHARSTEATLSLSNVQADQAGTVEVYALNGERATRYLGHAKVGAGANGTVDVALNQPARGRLQVVMSNGNHAVATLEADAPLTN